MGGCPVTRPRSSSEFVRRQRTCQSRDDPARAGGGGDQKSLAKKHDLNRSADRARVREIDTGGVPEGFRGAPDGP